MMIVILWICGLNDDVYFDVRNDADLLPPVDFRSRIRKSTGHDQTMEACQGLIEGNVPNFKVRLR